MFAACCPISLVVIDVINLPATVPPSVRNRVLACLNELPPCAALLTKLIALLAQDHVCYRELATTIESDAVLAGNILRIANSGLYGHRGTITSVPHAVSVLGHRKLRNVALGLNAGRMWHTVKFAQGFCLTRFNQHSLGVAIVCDHVATRVPVVYPEGAFIAGLFHDLGKLLMAVAIKEEFEAIEAALSRREDRDGRTRLKIESDFAGLSSAELSAAMIEKWNLPEPVVAAIRDQHGPTISARDGSIPLSKVLEVADDLTTQLNAGLYALANNVRRSAENLESLRSLGISNPGEIFEQLNGRFALMRDVAVA